MNCIDIRTMLETESACVLLMRAVWCVYTGLCDAPSAAERWLVGSICFVLPLSDAAAG